VYQGVDWALLLHDRVAALLDIAPDRPLKDLSTSELAQELVCRQDGACSLVDALLACLLLFDPLAMAAEQEVV
jgi:hypothetical protein